MLALALCLAGCSSNDLEDGDQLLAKGEYGDAIAAWETALERNPGDLVPLTRIATAQARMDRLDLAEATLLRGVDMAPRDPRIRHNLALVYLKQKDLDKALATFEQVLAIEATYPNAHYYIGLIHEMRGDEASAKDHYIQEVNHGTCLEAWDGIWRFNQKSDRPKPNPNALLTFSLVLLVLAAFATGVRFYLEARHGRVPSGLGVD